MKKISEHFLWDYPHLPKELLPLAITQAEKLKEEKQCKKLDSVIDNILWIIRDIMENREEAK